MDRIIEIVKDYLDEAGLEDVDTEDMAEEIVLLVLQEIEKEDIE